jgi:hypothetical protein
LLGLALLIIKRLLQVLVWRSARLVKVNNAGTSVTKAVITNAVTDCRIGIRTMAIDSWKSALEIFFLFALHLSSMLFRSCFQ